MNNTLGSRISDYRKRANITQDQLAEKMNVSPQAVSKWENDLSCPDISLLPQLADLFNVSIDELMRGDESKANEARIVPQEQRKPFEKMLLKINMQADDGSIKVNLPLVLIKAALDIGMELPQVSGFGDGKLGEKLKEIDFASILMMVESGVVGKLVEIRSGDNEMIDIIIE